MGLTGSEEDRKGHVFSPDEGPGDVWYPDENYIRQTPQQRRNSLVSASQSPNEPNSKEKTMPQSPGPKVSVTFFESHWKAIIDLLEIGCRDRGEKWMQWQRNVSRVIQDAIDLEKIRLEPPPVREETWEDYLEPGDFEPLDYDNQGNPYGHPSYGQDW
jgi:hypothetical protein